MPKKDNIETFIDKIYSTPPKKTYKTNKRKNNHIDEIWFIDLADFWIIRLQITKDIDIYSLSLTILVNICGLYHLKISIVKLSQMKFQII